VAFVSFVEAARGQHEEIVIGARPRLDCGLVLVPVQHQIDAVREQAARPLAVCEIGESVVHERQPEAR
jgi:hypothetical protein